MISTARRCKTGWLKQALLLSALILPGAQTVPRIVPGPESLPNVEPAMQHAEYWIGQMRDADTPLANPKTIQAWQRQWQAQGLILDIVKWPATIPGNQLRGWLNEDNRYLRRVARYSAQGQPLVTEDYDRLGFNRNLAAVQGSNPVGWGMTVQRTSLRLLPSPEVVTSRPGDLEFNVLQHSSLRLAEAVAILHQSQDQAWLFVAAVNGRGWVRAEEIGRAANRETVLDYLQRAQRIVTTAEMHFQDETSHPVSAVAHMGCALAPAPEDTQQVLVPTRNPQGELEWRAVRPEPAHGLAHAPRPFTPRVIVEQAFEILGQPYGWGGATGYGDCAEFIQRIGWVCGIHFPPSTSAMRRAWLNRPLPKQGDSRKAQLAQWAGKPMLLYLPGHIMLMLGQIEGRTYVIHNLYGIQGQDAQGDLIQRVGRVVVSDLSLGSGSRKGSLLQRLDCGLEFCLPNTLDK